MEAVRLNETSLNHLLVTAMSNYPTVSRRGEWAGKEMNDLLKRIPIEGREGLGFCPAIACVLNMIPPVRQYLSARCHYKWNAELVHQIRKESRAMTPDSETTWYLAAKNLEIRELIDKNTFLLQVAQFNDLREDPEERQARAREQYRKMVDQCTTTKYGFPFTEIDVALGGTVECAWIAGHRYGVTYSTAFGMYVLRTYLPNLWEDGPQEKHYRTDEAKQLLEDAKRTKAWVGM